MRCVVGNLRGTCQSEQVYAPKPHPIEKGVFTSGTLRSCGGLSTTLETILFSTG